MRMKGVFAAEVVASVLGAGFACRAGEPFTDEASILAVSRDEEANDLESRRPTVAEPAWQAACSDFAARSGGFGY
jgi:hypothetical protein